MSKSNTEKNYRFYDDRVPEHEKNQFWYLKGNTEYIINTMIQHNTELRLARDYYAGNRNVDDYKFIEDRYGFGSENDLQFQPIVRKHIEVLKGQFLQNPFEFFITCTDSPTLSKIERTKRQGIINDFINIYKEDIDTYVQYLQKAQQDPNTPKPKDRFTQDVYKELQEYYNTNWKSLYEITAKNLLDYLLSSKQIDFKTKFSQFFENILVYGSAYYRVKNKNNGLPEIEIINPIHFFYSKNTNDKYINQCTKVAYRFYRTPEEILNEYGEFMTDDEIDKIFNTYGYANSNQKFAGENRLYEGVLGVDRNEDYYDNYSNVIECFHCEWLANNEINYFNKETNEIETKYRMDRYSSIKIGSNIYVNMGRDVDAPRSINNSYATKISYNGFSYTDYNSKPYSLVLKTKDLQDKFDIAYFRLAEYISQAGNKGMVVDLSQIPEHYGDTPEERELQAIAYIKQGYYGINSAQEGNQRQMTNTIYSGYDLSAQSTAVQAYSMYMEIIENTISSFTGVPRQMLAQIEQRDPVKGIEVSLQQGLVINKQLFHLTEQCMCQCLIDTIDSYKQQMTSDQKEFILGSNNTILELDPNYFTFTDHNITVSNSIGEKSDYHQLRELAYNLVQNQAIELDAILDILQSKSITEAHKTIKESYNKKSSSDAKLRQAQEQLEMMSKDLEEANKALNREPSTIKQPEGKNTTIEEEKLKIEREKLELQRQKIKADQEIKKMEVNAEIAQLYNDNKKDDEIKNLG